MSCYNSVVDYTINIIQGDTYTGNFTIKQDGTAVGTSVVSTVYFTCDALEVQKQLTYDATNTCFVLSFTTSETSAWRAGTFSFDLTLHFATSGAVSTEIWNGKFTVLKKTNTITTGG